MTTALTSVDKQVRGSHMQHLKLIRLGHECDANRLEQLKVLYWFYERPIRCQRLGYESFEEYFAQDDVQHAIGLSSESQGALSKLWAEFKISAILPEAGILGPGRSKVAAALPNLRPRVDEILDDLKTGVPQEEIEEKRMELWREVDAYRALPVREVEAQVQKRREPAYHLTTNSNTPAIGKVDTTTGEIEPVLVCKDDCDRLAFATVVRRLTRSYCNLLVDDDGLWAFAPDGTLKLAARWPHRDVPQETKRRVAEACRAEQRI